MLYNLRHVSLCHVGGGKRTREDRTKKREKIEQKKREKIDNYPLPETVV